MYQNTTIPLHAAPSEAASARQRNLTLADIQSDSISKLVQKHLGKQVKWDPKVVETIMETELVPSGYSPQKLMLLEFSQYLEKVSLVDSLLYTIFSFFLYSSIPF
jgi:hypothetical protein